MIFLEKYHQYADAILTEARVSKLQQYKKNRTELEQMREAFLSLSPEDFLKHFSTIEVWDVRLAQLDRQVKEERKEIDQFIKDNEANPQALYRLIGLELDPDTGQMVRSATPQVYRYHNLLLKRGSGGATKAKEIGDVADPAEFAEETPKFTVRLNDTAYLDALKMELADGDSVKFDVNELNFKELADPALVKLMDGMEENRYFSVDNILMVLSYKYRFNVPETDKDRDIVLRDIAEKIPSFDDDELYNNMQASWFRRNSFQKKTEEPEDKRNELVRDFIDAYTLTSNAIYELFYRTNTKGSKTGLTKKEFIAQHGPPTLTTVANILSKTLPIPVTTSMVRRILFPAGGARIKLKGGRFVPNTISQKWDDLILEKRHFKIAHEILLEKTVKSI